MSLGLALAPQVRGFNLVDMVMGGGPAFLAGVRRGDFIVSVDGIPVTVDNIAALMSPDGAMVGSSSRLTIDRAGSAFNVDVARSAPAQVEMTQLLLDEVREGAPLLPYVGPGFTRLRSVIYQDEFEHAQCCTPRPASQARG